MTEFEKTVKAHEKRELDHHNIILDLVDDDIADIFKGYEPGTYAVSIPINMQIARKLTTIAKIMELNQK